MHEEETMQPGESSAEPSPADEAHFAARDGCGSPRDAKVPRRSEGFHP